MPVEDQNEFHETIVRGNLSMDINTNSNATSQQTTLTGTESHENPFQDDGPLSKKADYIVRNSTISRTELKIADPDQERERRAAQEEIITSETIVASEASPMLQASAPPPDATDGGPTADRPNDIKVNGNVEESQQQPLTPQSVEVEVGKANASQPEAQQAEEVKLPKDKKCKCCVVQ